MIVSLSNGFVGQAHAQPLTPEQKQAVADAVKEYMQQQQSMRESGAPPPPSGTISDSEKSRLDQLGQPRSPGNKYGSTMEGSGKLIYARPFVSSPKAIVGGVLRF